MYNYFKNQQEIKRDEQQRKEQEKYSQWLLKNQDIKQQAKQKQKLKLQDWVCGQLKNGVTTVIQDDHYKQWRFLKQFRDVQNQQNFKGYKTFMHRPNYQMNKIYNQRQRKQILQRSLKKQHLVDKQIIKQAQRSRSMRSQGPLNPKITFRPIINDHEYIQPIMRFQNVTDKQRFNQTHLSFDDKFKSVYSSFQLRKSRIGVPRVSRLSSSDTAKSIKHRYTDRNTQMSMRLQESRQFKDSKKYNSKQSQNQQELAVSKQLSKGYPVDFIQKMPSIQNGNNSKRKTYFKLAKTMELQGCKKIKKLLLDSQYDRAKDLSNLKMNATCQNYFKKPIL